MFRFTKIATAFLFSSVPIFAHGQEVIGQLIFVIYAISIAIPIIVLGIILGLWWSSRPNVRTEPAPNFQITHAWQEAANILAFEFEPKFRFQLEGTEFTFLGYIKAFGAPKGTFLGPIVEHDVKLSDIGERVKELGFNYSELPNSYNTFSEKLFKDTLNGLGYFGPENRKPQWYTGP